MFESNIAILKQFVTNFTLIYSMDIWTYHNINFVPSTIYRNKKKDYKKNKKLPSQNSPNLEFNSAFLSKE